MKVHFSGESIFLMQLYSSNENIPILGIYPGFGLWSPKGDLGHLGDLFMKKVSF